MKRAMLLDSVHRGIDRRYTGTTTDRGVHTMLTKLRVAAAIFIACTGLLLAVTTGPASAYNAFNAMGTVHCDVGGVEGVWVYAGSASGWAQLGHRGSGSTTYNKGLGIGHPTYQLDVGCGGTPQRWASNNYTSGFGWMTSAYQANYYVSCNGRGSCWYVGEPQGSA
jgi:hypothetical protein